MKIEVGTLVSQIEALKRKPESVNGKEEAEHLINLISHASVSEKIGDYTDPCIVGIGGSGIIVRAQHQPSQGPRALKFPRKRPYEHAGSPDVIEVDPEREALEKISHQNITRLYDAFMLPNGVSYCMITQYVEDSKSLDTYVSELIANPELQTRGDKLDQCLREIAKIVYEIVGALDYLHQEAKLLHFDIKPENILVSPSGVPFVTDLGFARDLNKFQPDDKLEVGFTWKYAHPALQDPHRGARVTNVPQKAKSPLTGRDLHPKFDVFAFGRTLQELLALIYLGFGEAIQARYTFDYLHVVACLSLDGKNGSTPTPKAPGEFMSDAALGMATPIYVRSKFTDFASVRECLERLLGFRRFEDELEEVDRWYGSTIKISESGSTILTPRVASTINHPALQRLKRERQLGMLDSVFPGATHSRFQHSLGGYHAATLYLLALYYDSENPLFRALVNVQQCKALLIGMLIHDIGHTAYGHELEEIDEDVFSHHVYVRVLLQSPAFIDTKGRTLREVIEGRGEGCWGVPIEQVMTLFERPTIDQPPLEGVLHDILDSQVDADKFDYLVRDTVESRVAYGLGIDFDRFLRSLTTFAKEDGTLRLAIKQKGAASAEAFAHARYQLYQSMYWHHTFRATKAMLVEAIQRIQRDLDEKSSVEIFDKFALRTAYIRNVLGASEFIGEQPQSATSKRQPGRRSQIELIDSRLKKVGKPLPIRYRDDEFMVFLSKLSEDDQSSALINDLVNRNYYKRLLEVSPAKMPQPEWDRLRDRFRKNRAKIHDDVTQQLLNALRSHIQSEGPKRATGAPEPILERISTIARTKAIFLVDVPLRGWFASSETPIYVSDYKRRHFRAGEGDKGFEQRTDFWIDMLGNSMKAAAYIRVFCEPEVHSIVLAMMGAKEIYAAVSTAISELRQ